MVFDGSLVCNFSLVVTEHCECVCVCGQCQCSPDGVRISMDCFVREYQPEKYAAWIAGKDVGPHPENDQSKLYAGSRSRFVHTVVARKATISIFISFY